MNEYQGLPLVLFLLNLSSSVRESTGRSSVEGSEGKQQRERVDDAAMNPSAATRRQPGVNLRVACIAPPPLCLLMVFSPGCERRGCAKGEPGAGSRPPRRDGGDDDHMAPGCASRERTCAAQSSAVRDTKNGGTSGTSGTRFRETNSTPSFRGRIALGFMECSPTNSDQHSALLFPALLP